MFISVDFPNKITFLKELTSKEPASLNYFQVDFYAFGINLFLTFILTWALGQFYIRFSQSISSRESFARNFLPVGVATMFVITVVKSSISLSLGLVGALSIVRFRAAIKEPEELSYMFLAIAIGLGFGAEQRLLTLIMFSFTLAALYILRDRLFNIDSKGLFLTLSGELKTKSANQIIDVLSSYCLKINLRRWDESEGQFEAAFMAQFKDFEAFKKSKEALLQIDSGLRIGLMDTQGLI